MTEYRELLDTETILPGDEYKTMANGWAPCKSTLYRTPAEIGESFLARRPIPDEPEDVVRVEGEIQRVVWGDENIVVVHCAPRSIPSSVTINQRVTLLIPRPDPPVPKCPYCGMEMEIKHIDAEYWAKCSYSNCAVSVIGKARPTRREAIKAMTPKGGGQ